MNYQNLVEEINEYSTYFKYCDSIITKFTLFFKEFARSGSKFVLKSKKSMEDIYAEINKDQYFSSSLIKNLKNFSDEFKDMMDKLDSFFSRIEKELTDKITEFDKEYKTNNKNNLIKLSELNIYLSESKNKLEKTKNNYLVSCKAFTDYDKKYCSNKSKENMKDEELARIKEQHDKLKQTSETKKVYYRIEVTKLNDLLVSNENYYSNIIELIKKQEEERTTFYVSIILLFINIIKEFNFETKESISKNEKYIDEIFIKRDVNMFSLFFNKKNNNKDKSRFLYEEFLDYENINTTQNNKLGEINDNMPKNENIINDIEKKELDKIDINLALQIIELGKNSFIDSENMDNDLIELDSIIFNLIQRDEKIDSEKFMQVINYIDENAEGCKNFIYLLMGHYCLKNLENFNNNENIYLLNSILNMIINFIWEKDDYVYLIFLILDIGEKTVYYNSNDKSPTHYLCKLMAKNAIYHNEELWIKIIDLKIKMFAKIKIIEEFNTRRKNSVSKKDTGIISRFFGSKDEDNEKIEREILYSQIYKEKSSDYCTGILTEFISHFMNYDFIEEKTKKVIEHISNQYSLNIKQKNYFLEMINSNIIYKEISNPYFSESDSDCIKYDTQEDLDKLYFSFKSNKKFKSFDKNPKLKVFLFALKYLNNKDIIPLLCLNKEYYSKLKNIVYKNILIKYNNKIDFKKHIAIWKIILDYNSIKKKYNYKSILDSIKNGSNKNNIFDIIELDSVRTSFEKNQLLNQTKLCNILKAASNELPEVNYCQGMNHIASFILVLCEENEEETFYLFLSILFATDYCSLVVNDLLKLNSFFYCFERLLNTMLPEMNIYFKNVNVDCGYFLSPWFITLFTSAFNYANGQDNLKIIVRIFELFLLSGWKAIFKIGISLIKNNSLKIISSPYDQLVHYLNNEIIRSEFFRNENLDEIMNISLNFKISNKLINNLCKEFEMKKNIMNKKK